MVAAAQTTKLLQSVISKGPTFPEKPHSLNGKFTVPFGTVTGSGTASSANLGLCTDLGSIGSCTTSFSTDKSLTLTLRRKVYTTKDKFFNGAFSAVVEGKVKVPLESEALAKMRPSHAQFAQGKRLSVKCQFLGPNVIRFGTANGAEDLIFDASTNFNVDEKKRLNVGLCVSETFKRVETNYERSYRYKTGMNLATASKTVTVRNSLIVSNGKDHGKLRAVLDVFMTPLFVGWFGERASYLPHLANVDVESNVNTLQESAVGALQLGYGFSGSRAAAVSFTSKREIGVNIASSLPVTNEFTGEILKAKAVLAGKIDTDVAGKSGIMEAFRTAAFGAHVELVGA